MGGFTDGERTRLEGAGFVVVDDVASIDGARVEIIAAGDGVTTTLIELPSGARLCLSMRFVKDN